MGLCIRLVTILLIRVLTFTFSPELEIEFKSILSRIVQVTINALVVLAVLRLRIRFIYIFQA